MTHLTDGRPCPCQPVYEDGVVVHQMSEPELLEYMGRHAPRWAEEFCKIAGRQGHNLDVGWVEGWFANAIEAGRNA